MHRLHTTRREGRGHTNDALAYVIQNSVCKEYSNDTNYAIGVQVLDEVFNWSNEKNAMNVMESFSD
jgi:hypothetical protein